MRRDNSQNVIIPHFLPFCRRYTDTHRHARARTEPYIHMYHKQPPNPIPCFLNSQRGEIWVPKWAGAVCERQRGMFSVAAWREVDLVQGLSSPARHFQCSGETLLRNCFCPSEMRAMLRGLIKPLPFCMHFTEIFFPSTVPWGHLHLMSCQLRAGGSPAPPHHEPDPAVQPDL